MWVMLQCCFLGRAWGRVRFHEADPASGHLGLTWPTPPALKHQHTGLNWPWSAWGGKAPCGNYLCKSEQDRGDTMSLLLPVDARAQ